MKTPLAPLNQPVGRLAAVALGCSVLLSPGHGAWAQRADGPSAAAIAHHVARRVFDPEVGGQNVGNYFIRMPGGMMFRRDNPGHAPITREFFRFSIQIKVDARRVWLKEAQQRLLDRRSGKNRLSDTPKPLSAFFDDDTLSAGDVVVAIEGFRVFRGSQIFPWRAADFVPLDRWQRMNGAKKGLSAMERESRRNRQ